MTSIFRCGLIGVCLGMSSCVLNNHEVDVGQNMKMHAASGVWTDIFVPPDDPTLTLVDVSSEANDPIQVSSYFKGSELERILILRDFEGMTIVFENERVDPSNPAEIEFFLTRRINNRLVGKRYKLVEILDDDSSSATGPEKGSNAKSKD